VTVAKIAPQAHTRSFCVIHTTVDNISNNTASRGLSAMTDPFVSQATNVQIKTQRANKQTDTTAV